MNNSNKDDSSTISLDQCSLSGLNDSVWEIKTLHLDPLGTFEEWMEAAEEKIRNTFWRHFLATVKQNCSIARAAYFF
eukprot:9624317-Ditylum_brightwellii.AAC.1